MCNFSLAARSQSVRLYALHEAWSSRGTHATTPVHQVSRGGGACAAGRTDTTYRRAPPGRCGRSAYQPRIGSFLQELKRADWNIGRNLQTDVRWATDNADTIRKHAVELAATTPDVILASASAAVEELLQATRSIPIVFVQVGRPGRRRVRREPGAAGRQRHGFMLFEYSISGKWLELLKQIAPSVTRAAVLRDPAIAPGPGSLGRSNPWRRHRGWR